MNTKSSLYLLSRLILRSMEMLVMLKNADDESVIDIYVKRESDADFRYQLADAGSSSYDDGESSDDVQDSGGDSDDDDDQWSETFHGTGLPPTFTMNEGLFLVLPSDAKALDYFYQATLWENIHGTDCSNVYPQIARISNYWSSYLVLGVPQFAQLFTKNRFMSLWYNIHVADNTTSVPPSRSRLALQNFSTDNNTV